MTDLIERLRSKSPYLHGSSAERTMGEAADEIELLRAQGVHLADALYAGQQEIERLKAEIMALHKILTRWSDANKELEAKIERLRADKDVQRSPSTQCSLLEPKT